MRSNILSFRSLENYRSGLKIDVIPRRQRTSIYSYHFGASHQLILKRTEKCSFSNACVSESGNVEIYSKIGGGLKMCWRGDSKWK